MTTPSRPAPVVVEKWISRSAYLRWFDALAGWLVAVAITIPVVGEHAVLASVAAVVVGVMLRPLRVRWRPVSGWIGLVVSRSLRPGDRAWFVRGGRADSVLITARRGIRLSIAGADRGEAETITVRRTRVFLIPHDPVGGPSG